MSANSSIEWTNSTWSPLRARVKADAGQIAAAKGYASLVNIATRMAGHVGPHCEHASPGCEHCYSENNNIRCLPSNGTGLPFDRRARDLVDIHLDEKILAQPLRWKAPRKIFVNSQTDTFREFVPDHLIDRIFAVMALCPQHTFQVLTKRAVRMREWMGQLEPDRFYADDSTPGQIIDAMNRLANVGAAALRWPLPNVWLGVSCEDQQRADERLPHLLQTPAAVRFISAEPLLGPLNLSEYLDGKEEHGVDLRRAAGSRVGCCTSWTPPLDWVIVGGESGPGARPCNVEWIRDITRQCRDAVAACFVKQLGSNPEYVKWGCLNCPHCLAGERCPYFSVMYRLVLKSRKGSDMAEWPEDLRVREMPEVARG